MDSLPKELSHIPFLEPIAQEDIDHINHKEQTYRGSWKKRGGTGAFMMLARKWDRIENIMQDFQSYDLFKLAEEQDWSGEDSSILAEIRDLRRYLMLVESQMVLECVEHDKNNYTGLKEVEKPEEPSLHELNQDFLSREPSGGTPAPPMTDEQKVSPHPKRTTAHYDSVRAFMQLANQPVPDSPAVPDVDTRMARAYLLLEEVFETIQRGFGLNICNGPDKCNPIEFDDIVMVPANNKEPNLEEIADGCADVKVIATGTLISCGIKDGALQEGVDAANLRKFTKEGCPKGCCTYEEATRLDNTGQLKCRKCHAIWSSGYLYNGKWIKPANFTPPNVARILENQCTLTE